jgi:leucyl-tRNA synthetase
MMICLNAMEKGGQVGREQWRVYLRLLAPFAPHLCEELWEKGGMTGSIHLAAWPAVDESLLVASTETLTVQVNGKRRGLITLPRGASEKEAVSAARTLPTVVTACAGKEVVRTVYVPGKILNLVV